MKNSYRITLHCKLLFVAGLTYLLLACGGGSEKNEFLESALGEWRTGCQNFGINSDYGQVTLNVMDTTFEFVNEFYTDPRCTVITTRYRSVGTLLKHDSLIQNNQIDSADIDFQIEQVTVELLRQSKVDEFSESARCARTDWAMNISVDVSNCDDIIGSSVPRIEYDTYQTSRATHPSDGTRNVLYTGLVRGLSESSRPETLDYLNPHWQIIAEPTM